MSGMQKAYSDRFYPTSEQENLLCRTLGCVRLVYNQALAMRTEAWYEDQAQLGYCEFSTALTSSKLKAELSFLNDVSSPLQQGLRHLQAAKNFFDARAKYPNFFLAFCQEPLNLRCWRQLPQRVTSTAIVRLNPAQQGHINLRFTDPRDLTLELVKDSVGLDAGSSLFTLSTGEKIANPQHFNCYYKRLGLAQQSMSRKQKGSIKCNRARVKARIQQKIANCRQAHLHNTTRLAQENQLIAAV